MKKKALLASILTIAMCFSVIAGATFALFTSESTVNVAVTSGTVDVDATILEDTLATSSLGVAQANGAFENGGNAAFDANAVLVLTNMTPGDAVTFSIEIKNNSNVNVQYRVKWAVDGKLYEALVATADDTPIVNNTSAWELWTAPATDAEKVKTVEVELTLPTEADNEYQNQSAAIAFTVEAVQGNGVLDEAASEEQLRIALASSGTVTLTDNITLSSTIVLDAGKDVVIDLAGKELTCANGPTIINNGKVTFVDNTISTFAMRRAVVLGTVSNTSSDAELGRNAVVNNGEMIIMGGAFFSAETYAINNNGDLVISDATTGGIYNAGSLELNNVTASNTVSGRHTVYHSGDKLVINGGTYENSSNNAVIFSAGENATINGGTFNMLVDSYILDGTMVVNGGSFNGFVKEDGSVVGTRNIGKIEIKAGSFNFQPGANDIADNYYESTYDEETGSYVVGGKSEYTFIKTAADLAALSAKALDDGTKLVLENDVDMQGADFSAMIVKRDATVSFFGNGYTVSNVNIVSGANDNTSGQASMFYVYPDSALTVSELTLSGITATSDLIGSGYAAAVVGYCEGAVTLDNVDVVASEINGAKSSGSLVGHLPVYGSLTATDCDVTDVTVTLVDFAEEPAGHYAGKLVGTVQGPAVFTGCTYDAEVAGNLNAKNVGELYGRFIGSSLVVDGYSIIATGLGRMDGTNSYMVYNAAGLKTLNDMMANKTAGYKMEFALANDIDFAGYAWTPVDSHADTAFCINGIDGRGFTIYNFTVNGQAMFTRFAGAGDVLVKDLTFVKANVNSTALNTSLLTVQSYQNVTLDNVDVKDSTIKGAYKVATLIASVYNESSTTVTATLKDCDVENVTVTATSYDFCTAGLVAFVYEDDNDKIVFENCTVTDVTLNARQNGYTAHAWVYSAGSDTLYNEVEGVTVTNCTFVAL